MFYKIICYGNNVYRLFETHLYLSQCYLRHKRRRGIESYGKSGRYRFVIFGVRLQFNELESYGTEFPMKLLVSRSGTMLDSRIR